MNTPDIIRAWYGLRGVIADPIDGDISAADPRITGVPHFVIAEFVDSTRTTIMMHSDAVLHGEALSWLTTYFLAEPGAQMNALLEVVPHETYRPVQLFYWTQPQICFATREWTLIGDLPLDGGLDLVTSRTPWPEDTRIAAARSASRSAYVAELSVEVEEEYRRQGYGRAVVEGWVQLQHSRGRVPLACVDVTCDSVLAFMYATGAMPAVILHQFINS